MRVQASLMRPDELAPGEWRIVARRPRRASRTRLVIVHLYAVAPDGARQAFIGVTAAPPPYDDVSSSEWWGGFAFAGAVQLEQMLRDGRQDVWPAEAGGVPLVMVAFQRMWLPAEPLGEHETGVEVHRFVVWAD